MRSQFDKDSNLPICQGVKYLNLTRVSFVLSLNHSPSRYQIYFETHIVSFKAITVNGSVTSGPEKQMSVGMKMSPLLDFQNRWRRRREAELQFLKSSHLSLQTKLYFLGRHFGDLPGPRQRSYLSQAIQAALV